MSMEQRERCPKCNELLDHSDGEFVEEWCIEPACDYYRAE